MKTIFFPFTWIDNDLADALSGCFGPLVLYQPSNLLGGAQLQKLVQKGLVELQVPVQGDESKLDAVLKDFHQWGGFHEGDMLMKAALQKINAATAPFFDETSTAQIRSDIKKYQTEPKGEKRIDPLLRARIFLHLAHEFDFQSGEINRDLEHSIEMEQELFTELKGETTGANKLTHDAARLFQTDPGNYLTAERVEAWATLFLSDQQQKASAAAGLFLTHSQAVWEHVVECAADIREVIRINKIPSDSGKDSAPAAWRADFQRCLKRLAGQEHSSEIQLMEKPVDETTNMSLTIHMISGIPPAAFWVRLINSERLQAAVYPQASQLRNTLIGRIEA